LTGGTGSLGAHIIHRLCSEAARSEGKTVCLVRAKDHKIARTRILDVLSSKQLQVDLDRIVVYSADVSKERLGLSADIYDHLVQTIDTVIHVSYSLIISLIG
jgi:thioester reductase-like protein